MTGTACKTFDSGLGRASFVAHGTVLDVRLDRLTGSVAQPAGAEEMLAVLEGQVRVIHSDETHDLAAGEGLLIPAHLSFTVEPRGEVVLYRVRAR